MKKISWLIVSVILLALVGCGGGGGDANGNQPTPKTKIDFILTSFDNSNSRLHILLNLKPSALPKDVKVILKNFSLSTTNECRVFNYSFNGSSDTTMEFRTKGDVKVLTVDSDYSCPDDTQLYSNNILLHYNKWVSNSDGSSKRGPFSESINLAYGSGGDGSSANKLYQIFPPEQVVIDKSDEIYQIDVAVSESDENGIHPATDVNVTAEFLQPVFGWLEQYTTFTDSSGTAHFIYHSPKNLRGLTRVNLYFYVGSNSNMRRATKLVFKPIDTVERIYLMPQTIQVTKANEEHNITIITVNHDNIGVPAEIKIEQLYSEDDKDYGKFSSTTITTNADGIGTVTYTAPSSIFGLEDKSVTVTEPKSNLEKELQITYDQGSVDYQISIDTPNSLSIEQNSTITVSIHEKGNKENIIDDEAVKDVVLSVKDYYNMLNFEGDSIRYSYSGDAKKDIDVETKRVSGVAIIEATATINNGKRDITIKTAIPVTILSGDISSISLSYIKTEADDTTGLFYDYYNVHAVDKYANPVNNGSHFHPTLICGGNESNATAPATILPATSTDANSSYGEIRRGPEYTIFQDIYTRPFDKVNPARDRLIVLPTFDASNKDYLGGWTIFNVFDDYELALEEEYYGQETKGLRYIVGDEDRLLLGEVHVASVTDGNDDQNYTIGADGTGIIKVSYDPMLVGHTYTLATTAYGDHSRSGTAIKASFRGTDIVISSEEVEIPKNGSVDANLTVTVKTPADGIEWVDDIDLVPNNITVDDPTKCTIDFNAPTTDLHVDKGKITVNVKYKESDDNASSVTCTVQQNTDYKGAHFYYEY